MATGGNPPQIQMNLDVQRLADANTNRNDLVVLIPKRYEGDPPKFRECIKQIEKYATGGNPPQIQVNLDVQRLADAITNRNDLLVLIPNRYEGDPP